MFHSLKISLKSGEQTYKIPYAWNGGKRKALCRAKQTHIWNCIKQGKKAQSSVVYINRTLLCIDFMISVICMGGQTALENNFMWQKKEDESYLLCIDSSWNLQKLHPTIFLNEAKTFFFLSTSIQANINSLFSHHNLYP